VKETLRSLLAHDMNLLRGQQLAPLGLRFTNFFRLHRLLGIGDYPFLLIGAFREGAVTACGLAPRDRSRSQPGHP